MKKLGTKEKKCILWDLDGTIIESEKPEFKFEIFSYATQKMGLRFPFPADGFTEHDTKKIFQEILEKNNTSDKLSKYKDWLDYAFAYIRNHTQDILPHQNAIELWQQCHAQGIVQVVVTNNRKDIAESYLKKFGLLSICHGIVSGDMISEPKPSPEPYLAALEMLQINTEQCIVVEDSIGGVASAKKANLFVIAWTGEPKLFEFSQADIVTEKLSLKTLQLALQR